MVFLASISIGNGVNDMEVDICSVSNCCQYSAIVNAFSTYCSIVYILELKPEKTTSHKDALTKFLSNDEPSRRTVFECDFEDRILQTEPETLPERIARTEEVEGSLPYVPTVQSVTIAVNLNVLIFFPILK